jgi:hypothetical protein
MCYGVGAMVRVQVMVMVRDWVLMVLMLRVQVLVAPVLTMVPAPQHEVGLVCSAVQCSAVQCSAVQCSGALYQPRKVLWRSVI